MAIIDRHALLDGVPVTAHLGPGQAIAIVGDARCRRRPALCSSNSPCCTGPADWRLVVIADDPDEWEWVTWLPHVESVVTSDGGPLIAAADDGTRLAAILARLESTDDRHVVVLTDRPDTLSARTGALRRYLAGAPSVAVIAVVEHGGTVPPLCRSELRIGSLCAGRWSDRQTDSGRQLAVHAAGVTLAVACRRGPPARSDPRPGGPDRGRRRLPDVSGPLAGARQEWADAHRRLDRHRRHVAEPKSSPRRCGRRPPAGGNRRRY